MQAATRRGRASLCEPAQTAAAQELATAKVAVLARRTQNLEALSENAALLAALARTLREDGRKSPALATSVLTVFFAFSHFSAHHPLISENQVGDAAIKLIDLETKRADEYRELEAKGLSEDKAAQLAVAYARQDRLLYVAFYMLLNLAEDTAIERKMKKRNIVAYLAKALDRQNVELLILAVTFLKKLSVFRENKDAMLAHGVVARLSRFVPVDSPVLMGVTLRLLLNLSFDAEVRRQMLAARLLPRVAELLEEAAFTTLALALLYHLSAEDKAKAAFAQLPALPGFFSSLMAEEDLHAAPELIALVVNLALDGRCAAQLLAPPRLAQMVAASLERREPLLLKVLRNAADAAPAVASALAPHLGELCAAARESTSDPDMLVELLGTLNAVLSADPRPVVAVARQTDLVRFLANHLAPGAVDDDVMLEAVMLIGGLCTDETADDMVAAGVPGRLYALMSTQKDDDEFMLQTCWAFYRLMLIPASRTALLRGTQVVIYLVDLLQVKRRFTFSRAARSPRRCATPPGSPRSPRRGGRTTTRR